MQIRNPLHIAAAVRIPAEAAGHILPADHTLAAVHSLVAGHTLAVVHILVVAEVGNSQEHHLEDRHIHLALRTVAARNLAEEVQHHRQDGKIAPRLCCRKKDRWSRA